MINKKTVIIVGVLLVVIGIALIVYGNSLNDNVREVASNLLKGGNGRPGNSWMYAGGVALGFGAVVAVLGFLEIPNKR